ncbi:3-hydroxyacyl-CoA dehydrogenase NAD-binding domain-containing protein [Piscinibacter koreensis]|jgi:3-hydroxyacyl-CoA dehydrogenase/enoyl-CoA hydratase/3-hydroxybutyryl-CoA epimerase|uniref:Enoyl-CoA hydratase/isomerase family protein n=1 Tax=Piscinibacter koreensis TaxID=2742824 RepID=A0A7Y6NSM7_9BURK|nr:3-hydroxyacyl-CoA dehydrogenase NAD-binding domain-containing protein [Schlegelella koreensis]NUZ08595.1 enoyl-CoA hydratase/isomerase family protein [Schlegelella koreensis]
MSIDYQAGADGIATLTWQMSDAPMNVLNAASMAAYADAVQRAIADPAVKGVIVTSGKPEFIAGGDLNMLLAFDDAQAMTLFTEELHALMRGIEKSGKPFVAALNGSALGGGYEVALSCHRRIAADNPKAQIGLPEVGLGLLPGGGGTQRLPRLIGIRPALPFLLEGKKVSPAQALKAGMVDELVAPAELLERARAWLLAARPEDTIQPWDRKGFKLPGGPVQSPAGYETFTAGNALLRAKTFGNYPAPEAIMSCVYNGCQVDIDTALKVEAREFVKLTVGTVSKNMIRTLFFGIGEAGKLAARPKGVPPASHRRVGILGAGMMGAGIACAAAEAGLDVVLLDTTAELAARGKAYGEARWAKQVEQGRLSTEKCTTLAARVRSTADFAALDGCDIVVEAVFEDRALKADVTRKAEAQLAPDTIFASNTSTLPITGLAQASVRPANFIGLHFFSPAEKMPLVEVIVGKATSEQCLARALDFVKALRKTPIVVNDSRGFYTSRVFSTYVGEGLTLLSEGVAPALIENAGRMAGMPVGPLALADEVSLELMARIRRQTAADLGAAYQRSAVDEVCDRMVDGALGRLGKKAGKGFYEYPQGAAKHLWAGLPDLWKPAPVQPGAAEVIQRLMAIQSIETVRCLEEGVLRAPIDADVGAILGWGFPAYLGGPIGQIHSRGVAAFVADCDDLARRHGPRFEPPKSLRAMAAEGKAFFAR